MVCQKAKAGGEGVKSTMENFFRVNVSAGSNTEDRTSQFSLT